MNKNIAIEILQKHAGAHGAVAESFPQWMVDAVLEAGRVGAKPVSPDATEALVADVEILELFGEFPNHPGRFAREAIALALSRQSQKEGHQAREAGLFHEVMSLLGATKLEHGLCKPRSRMACTHCNAKDKLDQLVDAYKGAPVVPQMQIGLPAITAKHGDSNA